LYIAKQEKATPSSVAEECKSPQSREFFLHVSEN